MRRIVLRMWNHLEYFPIFYLNYTDKESDTLAASLAYGERLLLVTSKNNGGDVTNFVRTGIIP